MIKVLHLITDLDVGGAERTLTQVMPLLAAKGVLQSVVCLSGEGALAEEIRRQGHALVCLGMRPGKPSLSAFLRLTSQIRRQSPDVIHSWLYHADLYGSLAALLMRRKIVWGLHNATLNPAAKRRTRFIVRLLSLLSRFVPRKIISCSRTAEREHAALGYKSAIFEQIPNGFDTVRFQPDPVQRHQIRASLRISDGEVLFGNIARFDPQKNQRGLLDAWVKFTAANPKVSAHLLLVGRGMDSTNRELNIWLSRYKLTGKVMLLGERHNVPAILNALDVFVLSSVGEAFPLALGEAMSSGVLCISTDVGDAELMLGGNGILVPAGDNEALAKALQKAAALPQAERETLRKGARQRILNNYSMERMAEAYLRVYQDVLNQTSVSLTGDPNAAD